MKNRRESKNIVALTNHNYLKKVYDGAKPQFAVVRNEQGKQELHGEQQQVRLAEEKRIGDIQYIERYANMGRLDVVKDTPQYQVWLAWKEEQRKGVKLC
ncbi:MAG: hypothetical protein MSH39_12055 [[Actinobacillus] rossii]|nr:hypothetical protein [[Actinobacillus] rossii]